METPVLETLEQFIREAMNKPQAPVASADMQMIFETMMNRPLLAEQDFPGIVLMQKLVSRIMSDPGTMEELKSSKDGGALAALLPFISQLTTAVVDWKSTQSNTESAA
jgi:hypothetical protein